MSAPVITGFCYAAALTVASTQVKGLFGLKFKASSFLEIWQGFFTNLSSIHAADAILGWSVIVILLLMRVHIIIHIFPNQIFFAFFHEARSYDKIFIFKIYWNTGDDIFEESQVPEKM